MAAPILARREYAEAYVMNPPKGGKTAAYFNDDGILVQVSRATCGGVQFCHHQATAFVRTKPTCTQDQDCGVHMGDCALEEKQA